MSKIPKIQPHQHEEAISLYKGGIGTSKIAIKFKVQQASVAKVIKDVGIMRTREHGAKLDVQSRGKKR